MFMGKIDQNHHHHTPSRNSFLLLAETILPGLTVTRLITITVVHKKNVLLQRQAPQVQIQWYVSLPYLVIVELDLNTTLMFSFQPKQETKQHFSKGVIRLYLENWNSKPGNAKIEITKKFMRKEGGLFDQVKERFYGNGEVVPKEGIYRNIYQTFTPSVTLQWGRSHTPKLGLRKKL